MHTRGCSRNQWAAFEHIPTFTVAAGTTWVKNEPAAAAG
jgi:hypothetical protein